MSRTIKIPLSELRVGCVLTHPVFDLDGRVLVPKRTHVAGQLKSDFAKRAIEFVLVHPDDLSIACASKAVAAQINASLQAGTDAEAKIKALDAGLNYLVENAGPPLRDSITHPGTIPYSEKRAERLSAQFESSTKLMELMISSLVDGGTQDASQLATIATNFVSEMSEDCGQTLAVSDGLAQNQQVSSRSVRLSVLAMAIAIEMGFDVDNVREVGLTGLSHDFGLYFLEPRLRNPHEPFTNEDWFEFMKHPIRSAEALERLEGISEQVRIASYQVHELLDGTGYPGGLSGNSIHLFARIVCVADVYITLVSQIRGRPALLPYDAMVYLLHQVRAGKFDGEVVRALLKTLSLFPVASYVRLPNGFQAKVLRANPHAYTTPIIQLLGDSRPGRDVIDASILSNAEAIRPLPTPNRLEMRLAKSMFGEVIWDGPNEA